MKSFKSSRLISLEEVKNELLKKRGFRDEYYKKDQDFEIAKDVIRVRTAQGLTQKDLAELVRTKQPSIARLESGLYTPSFRLLRAVANALNIELSVRFSDMREIGITKHTIETTQNPRTQIHLSSRGSVENSSGVTQ